MVATQAELQAKALKLLSTLLFLIKGTQQELIKSTLLEALFEFAAKPLNSEVKREMGYCLANLCGMDLSRIVYLGTKGLFSAMNAILEHSHALMKSILLSSLCALFGQARLEGYAMERALARHYMKANGVNVMLELEKSGYKEIRIRVFSTVYV